MMDKKQPTPSIAFDCDGVLINILPVLRDVLLGMAGKDIGTENQVCCYGFENHGITEEQIIEALQKTYPRYKEQVPISGAYELLKTLPPPVHVVTARHTDYAKETHEALNYHYPGIPFAVSFTHGHKNKAPFLKPYTLFVEDRGETAEYLTEHLVTVFLLDKPYNQGFGNDNILIFRIKDLYEIREYLNF